MLDRKQFLTMESEERHRLDTLCRMLNRDCPLKHEFVVMDVQSEEYDDDVDGKYTTIIDITEDKEAITPKQWLDTVNDEKSLTLVENSIFQSSYYRFKLLNKGDN